MNTVAAPTCPWCGDAMSEQRPDRDTCAACRSVGVHKVHPAPHLDLVRVVPPELEHGPFGVGDAAALRAEVGP